MAFTYCTNCGEKIDDSVEKCPHCNHPKGVDRVYGYASESYGKKENTAENVSGETQNGADSFGNRESGGQGGGNPWDGSRQNGQGGYGQGGKNPWENGSSQNGYGQNGYGQNGYNGQGRNPWEGGNGYGQGGPWQSPYGGPYGSSPWQPRERRRISVGLIVFSVINILLGTCCAGSIFGIIGLVFAITARDAATELEEIRRKKISLTINIIAVVLTVVFVVSFMVGVWQSGGFSAFLPQ